MAEQKDLITTLAKANRQMDGVADQALYDATGVKTMSLQKMTDMYLLMTFEERYGLFVSLLSEQGMEGMEVAKAIMLAATKKVQVK